MIARIIFSFEEEQSWDSISDNNKSYFLAIADKIIYSLRTMPVTEEMVKSAQEYWNPPTGSAIMESADAWSIWRSMIEAMRDSD